MTHKCPKLNDVFLCGEDLYSDVSLNSTCVTHLLNDENSSCNVRETGPIADVFEAEAGYIFAFNVDNLKISLTNGTDLIVNGSVIINYANETLSINGINYDNTIDSSSEQLDLVLPPMQKINKNATVMVLSLERLHLEAAETRNKVIAVRHNTLQHTWSLYILLGLATVSTVILWLQRRTKHVLHVHDIHHIPIYAPPIPSLWPLLRTGEGGVTNPPIHNSKPTTKIPLVISYRYRIQ